MTSTYLGMTVPTVGASTDTWGDELNLCLQYVDIFAGNAGLSILSGLTLSTAGSSSTFSCTAGVAGSTTLQLIPVGTLSKTTSSWVVGSGNGALDTGAIANNTWYHVFVINRPDTGVSDILISTSPTAPTMPSNYTRKRRIGAMKTNGSAQWTKFSQRDDVFLWDVAVQDANGTVPGVTTASSITVTVPPGVQVDLLCYAAVSDSGACAFLLSPLDISDQAPAGGSASIYATLGGSMLQPIRTNTSAQVRARINTATGAYYVSTVGWIDPRGKF